MGSQVWVEQFARIDASVAGRRRDVAVGPGRSQRKCRRPRWLRLALRRSSELPTSVVWQDRA